MDELTWIILAPLAVVALFAIIQSLFGVGLLVFGTPTLLLLGFPFDRTLALLLPASACISAAQLLQLPDRRIVRREYLAWSLPFVLLGLVFVLRSGVHINLKRLVGSLLLISAALRWSPLLQQRLGMMLTRQRHVYLVLMGAVHGVSNMGGGLLTILASSLHQEKEVARANIAAVYLAFALIQLGGLALIKPGAFDFLSVGTALLALAVFALGNRLFKLASPAGYQNMMSAFMLLYGVVLLF